MAFINLSRKYAFLATARTASTSCYYELEKISIHNNEKYISHKGESPDLYHIGLKEFLYKQTFSTVKWYESILFMKNSGINEYFEIGCGNVLSGINKRIDKELKTFSMNNIADIEEVVKNLS